MGLSLSLQRTVNRKWNGEPEVERGSKRGVNACGRECVSVRWESSAVGPLGTRVYFSGRVCVYKAGFNPEYRNKGKKNLGISTQQLPQIHLCWRVPGGDSHPYRPQLAQVVVSTATGASEGGVLLRSTGLQL